jgi:hypothetical protein
LHPEPKLIKANWPSLKEWVQTSNDIARGVLEDSRLCFIKEKEKEKPLQVIGTHA